MLPPTRAACTPTTRTTPPGVDRSANKPGSAPGDAGFKRAVDARKGGRDAKDGEGPPKRQSDPNALLAPRADGGLVVTAGYMGAMGARAPGKAVAATERPSAPRAPVALANVRVGGAPGTASLHATLGEGRHAGVELRAVEKNGRVAIELVATTPAGERALRGELTALREAVAARGCQGVSVDVRSGEGDGREKREGEGAPRDGDARDVRGSSATASAAAAPLAEGEILV